MERVEYKTSGTTLPLYDVDFTEDLPADSSLNSSDSSVKAYDSSGVEQSATIIANKTVSSMILKADIRAGVDGEDYKVVFRGVGTTTGKPFEHVIEVRVRDRLTGAL